jgi:hypothetical protein
MVYKRKTLRQGKKSTHRHLRLNSRSRKIRGGCKDGNCLFQTQEQPLPASLPHSNFSQNGGQFPPSFSNVPIRSFYPLNNYDVDPSRQMVSTTAHSLSGGKKSRRHRHRRRTRGRKQKGGFGLSTLFSYGASSNPSNLANLGFHDSTNPPIA